MSKRVSWVEQQSRFWYRLLRALCAPFFRLWVRRYRAVGMERVPASGGLFLIANHTSAIDPIVLGFPVKNRMLRGPGKEELFEYRVFGHIIRKLGMFPIKQQTASSAAIRTMVELYRAGQVVVVFPEGGRSDDGTLQPFFPDFARLMIRLKARMQPVGIVGARDLLPIGQLLPRPGRAVAVAFGEPFELSDFYDRTLTPELAAEAAECMRRRVADAVAAAATMHESL